jgi:O-antigen/teichoic acid export membrane protein
MPYPGWLHNSQTATGASLPVEESYAARVEPLDEPEGHPRLGREGIAGDMVRGSLWTLVAAVTGVPVAFVVNLVVARTLGPSGFGTLATYAAIVGVTITVLNLGISQSTVQWIAEARAENFEPRRLHLIRNCVGYHAILEGPAVAVIVVIVLRHASPMVVIFGALAMLATQTLGTSSVILTATARNAPAAKLSMIAGLALQVTTIVVALATRSASATYSAQLVAGVLGPGLCFLVIRGSERKAFLRPLLFRQLPAGFIRYGLSACGAALVGTLVYGRSEIFVLQAHGLKVAAGIFALATGLAGQITVPMDSVMGPLLPTAAALLAEAPDRATEAASRTLRVTSVLASFTMATAVPVVLIAIPLLFGHEFLEARGPFLLLGLVSCMGSVTVPLSMFLLATRNAGSMLRINIIALVADAALAIGLVPLLGLWGAVTANAGAQLLSFGLLTVIAIRRVGIESSAVGHACRPLILGIGATALALVWTLPTGLPIGVVLVTAPLTAIAALAIGFRRLPTWCISTADGDLVESSLPTWLRSPYRWIARSFSLVAAPTSESS